jgi:hypothetical protein
MNNSSRRRAVSTLQLLMPLCCGVFGVAHGVDLPAAPPAVPAASRPATGLDLRVPELRRVMPPSELLADMGSIYNEDPIEVIAAPPLVPLSSDTEVPLGIVDSLHWSVGHPTQAWRVVLPATPMP